MTRNIVKGIRVEFLLEFLPDLRIQIPPEFAMSHWVITVIRLQFLALTTILLTSLLGLIIVESYYWNSSSVCKICRFHSELGWETTPSKTVIAGELTYATNSMGMRSGEVDPSRGHILTLGDSVAFGLGVNNDETISHYLENDKKINRLKYQVLNISVPGFGIGQYYLNLQRNIDLLNPKLILLVVNTENDLQDTRQEMNFGRSKPILTSQNDRLVNLNPNISRFSCYNLYTRLRFAKFLIGNCQPNITEPNKVKISIGMIINAIRKLGIQKETPTLIVLSPALAAVKFATCIKTIPKDTCLEHDDAFYNVSFYNEYGYFKKIMKSKKIPYIDFLTHLVEYSKEQPIHSLYRKGDIRHFSPKGNYVFAQTIAKRLATDFDLNKLTPFSRRSM